MQQMEIPKNYDPKSAENKWYAWWMEKGYFRSVPDDREPYTIVIPPPNVTGVLHMGHMLNNTIQDVLIRRARMLGKNACWVPGTDHASIATEAKVVSFLKEQGINKKDLSREEFLKHAWSWKEKYGGIILEQLKKLGASCDWDRTRFTMDEELSESVIDVFVDLYKKGYIYRGTRMVNWDPAALTAVSDEEVFMKEATSKLYYVKYKIEGSDETITIATTRPETILGDTAICVHPEDERYTKLVGKKALVPMINRAITIIADEYVDKSFGTGALKVTPAHDKNDYELGKKHKLEMIDILNPDGTMSAAAQLYVGQDRFHCRKAIVKDLEEAGYIVKVEEIKNNIGYSERTNVVIEPRLSPQWFVAMKEFSKPAYSAVVNGEVNLIPDKFINTYKYWMENVQDWCISRQLWWGQRIPAWYDAEGKFVVAKTAELAIEEFQIVHGKSYTVNQISQDEDVVDTWFSSWLWPITVFDPAAIRNGKGNGNADLKYYYPTNDLVTAPEILFFWVARMIIAGYEYVGERPFSNVYLTGIVRDKLGRKMSKSLGNSPDPLDLIEKYGADGVRVGMLLCSPAGNDLPFDEATCLQGRNFWNKIWNASLLIRGFTVDANAKQSASAKVASEWFESRFNQQLTEINEHFNKFRLSDALMATYKLIWDDFCSFYLEMIKPEFVDGAAKPIDAKTYEQASAFLEKVLKIVHPFMPFISEELYHIIGDRKANDAMIVAKWPEAGAFDASIIAQFDLAQQVIATVRTFRSQKKLSPKEALELKAMNVSDERFFPTIQKLANITSIEVVNQAAENAFAFVAGQSQYFIPVGGNIDVDEERERLKKELEYNKGFLVSVQKKLANERFVQNAKPEVIDIEKKKMSDAEAKIKAIEAQLGNL
jgi:valyl-tRNA synthetase